MRRAKCVAVQHVMAMKSSAAAKALVRYKIILSIHRSTHSNLGFVLELVPGCVRHQAGCLRIMSSSNSQMPIVVLEVIGFLVSTVVQMPSRCIPEVSGAVGSTSADQFYLNANVLVFPGRTCLESVGVNRYSGWQPTPCQHKGGHGA